MYIAAFLEVQNVVMVAQCVVHLVIFPFVGRGAVGHLADQNEAKLLCELENSGQRQTASRALDCIEDRRSVGTLKNPGRHVEASRVLGLTIVGNLSFRKNGARSTVGR